VEKRSPTVCRIARQAGIDLSYQPLELAPGAHTFLGGVMIDNDGLTSRPALLAAGETAGGVHGANRLGGNALTEALVFGMRAGRKAAQLTPKQFPLSEKPSGPPEWLIEMASRSRGLSPSEIRQRVQREMSAKVFLLREENKLRQAKESLEDLRKTLLAEACPGGDSGNKYHNLRLQAENLCLIDTALLITRAALHRKESRGGHFRLDFPERSATYEGNTVQYLSGQKEFMEFQSLERIF